MKPSPFEYARPASIDGALSELAVGGKPLAGGQSLGPMMNLRVAKPGRLIEIAGLAELRTRAETKDAVTFGACVTHAEVEDGGLDPTRGFLTRVASRIAYRVVRNKGTMGGSLAHADPAADWLSALTAAGASLIVARPRPAPSWFGAKSASGYETRRIDIVDFVLGAYTTALAPDELLIGVETPKASDELRWGYFKLCRKVGELADAIGAVTIDPPRGFVRIVAGATGGAPLRLERAARIVAERATAPTASELAAEIEALAPRLDAIKRQQVTVCLERALAEALG